MKSVLLRGPVFSKSGYGEHTRQIYRYLREQNVKISIESLNWGYTPWFVKSSDYFGLIGEMQEKCSRDPSEKYDVTIQCQLPNEWDPNLGNFNIGVTAGVETDFANPSWTTVDVNKMDLVLVPSEFTKSSFEKLVKPRTEIKVVPESYYDELLTDSQKSEAEEALVTDFNFLTVGVLTGTSPETDRKNLFYLIKWFVEEFKNDKNVGLVIKTNKGRDTEIDKVATTRLLAQVLSEVGHTGFPRVYLLHGEMSRPDMRDLYKSEKIKAYISATRGEGFGLPLLEAAVSGLPVIATNWSAHTEFLNRGKWISLDFDLKEVADSKIDDQIFIKGSKWAEVREDDFKRKLRNFYKKPGLPKEWAKNLSGNLKKEYSIESIKNHYHEAIGDHLT